LLRITNFRIPVTDETSIEKLTARRLGLPVESIDDVYIVRRAIDARRKNNISFVYSLHVKINSAEGAALARLGNDKDVVQVVEPAPEAVVFGQKTLKHPPVVVGAGPAGLLAALVLAQNGYRPLLLERGRDVDRRAQDVRRFWQTGQFDPHSNVQFGEGGAGTFSDGKLTTRVNDPRMQQVLTVLVEAGAPPEIKYQHKPHVGTDLLRQVVKNIRHRIIELGGTVEFEATVTDVVINGGKLEGVIINGDRSIACETVLFGPGHSARDTYRMLYDRGVAIEAKPFAIGVRIEHPQELINRAQYGVLAGHPKLGAADYALVYHDKESSRTAYSFCMCPGGLVVAGASEEGGVVTNGMSLHARASGIANSALVVNVNPADCGDHPLSGIEFQRRYEALAFEAGGRNYFAPVQSVGDFLSGKSGSMEFATEPTYGPGVAAVDLRQCLPDFVTDTLTKALPEFGRKIRGFDHPGARMTGVETRTSAPVRIVRSDNFESITTQGFYPIGEGAGYAGGIMSAALDGVNGAMALMNEYKPG
jgi:uncharacterized FAD-dependent dehydrogenase